MRAIVAVSILVAAVAAFEAPPAIADPVYAVSAIPTNYNGATNSSGGIGDVRASWRNDGVAIGQVTISATAPPSQYFQRSGSATVYILGSGSNIWNIDSQPNIADSCEVNPEGTAVDCDALAVDWPAGASLAISFPTYVAPGTALTGANSIEPGTTMRATVGSTSVDSNESTAIGTVDPVVDSTLFPVAGARAFSGAANPGTMVSVENEAGTALGTALTDNAGAWQVTLEPGYGVVHTLFETVDGVRNPGDTGYYNSYTFAIVTPGDDSSWSGAETLSGTGQPGSSVVFDDETGIRRATAIVDSSGSWSTTLPANLTPGSHLFTIVNTISDGSTNVASLRGTVISTPPLAASQLAIFLSGGNAAADGESVRVVELVVTDALGRPVVGRRVRFHASAELELTASSALTDIHGIAWTTVAASQRAAARVTASIDDKSATTPPLQFVARRSAHSY